MTALPAASAAATWPVKIASGKFHGLMQATTPSGRCGRIGSISVRADLRRVVAQEIDRLAHFGDAHWRASCRPRARSAPTRSPVLRLQRVGGAAQDRARARPAASRAQAGAARRGGGDRRARSLRAARRRMRRRCRADRRDCAPLARLVRRRARRRRPAAPRRARRVQPSREAARRCCVGKVEARANSPARRQRGRAAARSSDAARRAGAIARASVTGSATSSSIGTLASATRLTNEVFAPFSSSRRTR